jgi:hypothetical protein
MPNSAYSGTWIILTNLANDIEVVTGGSTLLKFQAIISFISRTKDITTIAQESTAKAMTGRQLIRQLQLGPQVRVLQFA